MAPTEISDPIDVVRLDELSDRQPFGARVDGVDLVVVRFDDNHSVFSGRCLHRGVLLADGHVDGDNLICSVHGWDYRVDTGVSEYNPNEVLHRFSTEVRDGVIVADRGEIRTYRRRNPIPVLSDEYERYFDDPHVTAEEPFVSQIHELAEYGLERVGHDGPMAAMGVARTELPSWDSIQFVTAQLARLPLMTDTEVDTSVCIGPNAAKPLVLDRPIFVSDMSFGALSFEAKVALAKGAELAGTGICSGEGGILPEEQAANSRYLYELASARFGYSPEWLERVQALHFKCGQGAKTGTGGHLPGEKVVGKIAEVRGLEPGTDAVSPPRFPDWDSLQDYAEFAQLARERSGGVPIGVKLSAQRVEEDLDAALEIGVDYVILDGRGGGTGAAPKLFRDHISVPTIPALARARRHLDRVGADGVSLIITGGLRHHADFCKALAMGADAVAVANSAIQAIGCVGCVPVTPTVVRWGSPPSARAPGSAAYRGGRRSAGPVVAIDH